MTFRRNKLKGSKKKVSYNINDDYEFCSYEIDINLAQQVHNYLELTNELPPNNLDTSFRADSTMIFLSVQKDITVYFLHMQICVIVYQDSILMS